MLAVDVCDLFEGFQGGICLSLIFKPLVNLKGYGFWGSSLLLTVATVNSRPLFQFLAS